MTDDRIDFTPLDPTRDPQRFERIVSEVMREAGPALAGTRLEGAVFGQLVRWWKPLLVAASIAAVAAAATLSLVPTRRSADAAEYGLAEAMGVPAVMADWLESEETPTTAELLVALEDG